MSKLKDVLQEEALSEIGKVLAEADSKAATLVAEAKSKASERVEVYRKKAEVELHAATRRAEHAAELTVSTASMRAKGEMIALVRKRVLASLEEVAGRPDYDKVLVALAEEATKAAEPAEALVVHPDDEVRMSGWAMQKGLQLRTDPRIYLGVRIVVRGGLRSVENSLLERLERAWETLASGVAQRLWGESKNKTMNVKR